MTSCYNSQEVLAAEEAIDFTYPHYYGSGTNDECPVGHGDGCDTEHLATKAHNEELTDEDDQQDEQESLTTFEVEGRTSSEVGASIEEVPELEHHENREDVALLCARKSFCTAKCEGAKISEGGDIGMFKHIDQTDEDEEE